MSSKVFSRVEYIPTGSASDKITEGCVVLEGGGFRGIYSYGVMDYWMLNDLNIHTIVGVSAGAMGGAGYAAGQIGRSARVSLTQRYNRDYIGLPALLKSGSPIRLDYPMVDYNKIEPLNVEKLLSNDRRYVAAATNCRTGKSAFLEKTNCTSMSEAIKASASLPYITPMVEIDGEPYLDGGCSCKIPYQWAIDQGYKKIVVVRTREREYRKKINSRHTALKVYRKHPEFAEALDNSDIEYNRQCQELEELERDGRVFVIAPSEHVTVSRLERNMEKLGDLYWLGYKDAASAFKELSGYLNNI